MSWRHKKKRKSTIQLVNIDPKICRNSERDLMTQGELRPSLTDTFYVQNSTQLYGAFDSKWDHMLLNEHQHVLNGLNTSIKELKFTM